MKFIKKNYYSPGEDESELLAGFRRTGNLELLGRLYQSYMPLVYGLCLKYLKDEDASKDAVMQIFEKLIDKLQKHEVNSFKSWLYTLTRNYCLMELRANSRSVFVPAEDSYLAGYSGSDFSMNESNEKTLNIMERCMESLPEEQRMSINLFYLQEKCYKEVSEITGFDMNKVKSYIQNGKRNLKICMEKRSGNE